MVTPGIYGKLPSHGDFLQRNLPGSFVSEWDAWLQQFISGSREQIGVGWLEIYLTSPIWRFVLSQGVIDEHPWAGILMPSVDMVGRYFPFTIALQLADIINPLEYMSSGTQWFRELEEISLQALDGEYNLDEFMQILSAKNMVIKPAYKPETRLLDSFDMHFEIEFEEESANSTYPQILDILMGKLLGSYSVWSTAGSERISACVLTSQRLPMVSRIPAMLDGDWKRWGWEEPFVLHHRDQPKNGSVAV